jgi:hypothetical protein
VWRCRHQKRRSDRQSVVPCCSMIAVPDAISWQSERATSIPLPADPPRVAATMT